MAYWEFLLQKEGDHDWLPLETAHVEISEGRYRIIAHTSYCDTEVNIRLSRLLTEPMPPRRKSLKRVGTTNPSGLMVVIPFTHLTPGHWTVTCSALQTGAADSWEFGVQLQVLAIESGREYWETERDEAVLAEQLTSQSSTVTTDDNNRIPPPPPAASPEWLGRSPQAEEPFTAQTAIADLPLRLQLQHQALVAQSDVPLYLQGQVTTFSQVEGLVGEGTLWAQLRNPETGAVLHQASRAISIVELPSRFALAIALPATPMTRLLVGELSLWTASEPPQILAIQGFTVTLNLDALLELVANQAEQSTIADFDEPTAVAPEAETAAASAPETPDSKDGIVTPLSPRSVPFRLIYLPSSGLTLPPVIYQPLDKKTVGAPTLPSFLPQPRRDLASADDASANPPAAPTAKSLTLPPLGTSAKSAEPAVAPTEPAAPPEAPVELPNWGKSFPAQTDAESASSAPETSATATPQLAFEPDLQGRFWQRLSALAAEAQKAAADYKAQLEAAGVDVTTTEADPQQSDPAIADAASTTQAPINYEVVVYEPEEPPIVNLQASDGDSEPVVEVLPPGEPERQELGAIPVPSWNFPASELVAGAPLPLTIRLPAYSRRLAVKVWITDVQSRTLADRPRWLMNWSPTPEGDQTAFLQLQVPLGSIEARFEAIAIDLATQQESYKISEVRSIMPSSLPDAGVDAAL